MSRRKVQNMTHEYEEEEVLDWTSCLPDDAAITIFSHLSCRDRASLSSTCCSLRALGNHPCLWQALDLRPYNCDAKTASSLASRCKNLRNLRLGCPESVDVIVNLQARNLRELSIENCMKMTDQTLDLLAARHEALECLQLNGLMISSFSVKPITIRCPQLKRLWISGIRELDANAINAFAENCKNLTDVGFVDCSEKVDVAALGNVVSLKFISVAGTTIYNWDQVVQHLIKLPCLIGFDVSRTDIPPDTLSGFFSSSINLEVLCAYFCPRLERDVILVSNEDTCNNNYEKDSEISNWLERIISSSLLRVSKLNQRRLGNFPLNQRMDLILNFLRSAHEEVQERAVTALVNFLAYNKNGFTVAVMRSDDVIRLLLNLARSWREELQSGAAKAIAKLSVNDKVAKALLDEGGISILAIVARSANRSVAEEALVALSNLFIKEELKCPIDKAIGVETLVDLIVRWSSSAGGERILEKVVGVLVNLATIDKWRAEIASGGGVNALTTLIQTCKVSRVLEKVAQAFNNLTNPCYTKGDNTGVELETRTFDALVELTRIHDVGIRKEAACALRNLCCDDRNLEAVALAGGVQALVALANLCSNAPPPPRELQWSAAGALMELSRSEAYSIAICQEGGVAPLIVLAKSDDMAVNGYAMAALWRLAFYPRIALRIIEESGIDTIARLSSSSSSSSLSPPYPKVTRLFSALALTYMFDQRMDEIVRMGGTCTTSVELESARTIATKHIEAFVKTVSDPQFERRIATKHIEASAKTVSNPQFACIRELGELICSEAEIGRFVALLQNPCPAVKSCVAFALTQFTLPSAKCGAVYVSFLQNAGAQSVLQQAAAEDELLQTKIFARQVLRNMEWFSYLDESGHPSSVCWLNHAARRTGKENH